jgi:hypothetical protein
MDIILREDVPALQIPPYECNLNPIKLILNLLKQKITSTDIPLVFFTFLKEVPQESLGETCVQRLDERL